MIDVQNLSFSYAGFPGMALRGITLAMPKGQLCSIVGPNGAGKSTLCYALSGFIPHFYRGVLKGTVRVSGLDVAESSLGELAGAVGIVVQNPFNQITGARFTVFEEVAFGLENLGVPRDEIISRVAESLALTGLDSMHDQSPFALSGGQQQRLAIAAMIAMRPAVLILDEPTSQLDPIGTREVFGVLRRLAADQHTTIVLVEHKLEWVAAYSDRVIAIVRGQIVADGTARDVLTSDLIEEIGVGSTRLTRAARLARAQKLVDSQAALPVTLVQTIDFFEQKDR